MNCVLCLEVRNDWNSVHRPTWAVDLVAGLEPGGALGPEGVLEETETEGGWDRPWISMEMWMNVRRCQGYVRRDAASTLLEGSYRRSWYIGIN